MRGAAVPTLNRFPLLGLWAEEAARRLGYKKAESEALGHAYAVLYAIRAARKAAKQGPAAPARPAKKAPAGEELEFCGDRLDVTRDAEGRLQGHVGHEEPQTAHSYRAHVQAKFPPGSYDRLAEAFREVLRGYPPRALQADRLVYRLYDQWKKACAVGRSVDLDQLLRWCKEHRAR
jgi:hypothetical protein